MASNYENIKLGPCKVTFDPEGTTPVVLETTIGGVQLNYSETYRATTTDQTGTTEVKETRTGQAASVVVPFAEQDLIIFSKLIPGSTLVTGTTSGTRRLDIPAKVLDMRQYAKKVKLEPLAGSEEDAVILHKASPQLNISVTYNHENERIYNVTFKGYPDETNDNNLISFGDEDAV